ncbi:MAG: AMP-binding protein [Sulfuritalea sp.]|nr:AMP-binding protein [Sulfuritalea sp.]MDP1982282.1 AMP-binding protein [Sulfuritalea sp.]
MELSSLLAHHARYRPHATAVVFEDQRLDYRQFSARVDRVAHLLLGLGVHKTERVATLLPNSLELLELYWACARIGAVAVPLSPLLTGSGLSSLINDAGAVCLVTQRSLLPMVAAVLPELHTLAPERILLIDGAEPPWGDYAALAAAAPDGDPPAAGVGPDDLFNIMYTSGTTGLPKGIMHSHRVRAMYALLLGAAWRMTPESVVLHTGAIVFNGCFVTLMPAFHLGATYILHRQFDAAAMIDTIAREKVTHIMVVPAQIIALLDSPAFDPAKLASLQMILSLGAPLAQPRKDQLNQLLPGRFHELYGLTEGFVTILDKIDAVRKSGSVGCPPPFSAVRIVDEAGRDLPPGQPGEIVGRGPFVMQGYWGKPQLTADTLRDGWIFSGDIGYLDDEGYLYLVDRKKDMIDSGGVKVYPRDIEDIASRHPAVAEVAVFGIPHETWGETPLAAVVLRVGADATAIDLREWINERVAARYQRVQEVIILPAFPRNAAGKTLKREMREPYWAGRARQI